MLINTHLTVGTAVAVYFAKPSSIKELAICVTAGALGSVISDIDSYHSKSRRYVDNVVLVVAAVMIGIFILEEISGYSLFAWIKEQDKVGIPILGIAFFFIICIIGRFCSHRSFMHSLLAMFLLGRCMFEVYPQATPAFLFGFVTHVVLDSINHRGIQFFYPFSWNVCLHICKSDGWINKILFYAGAIAFAVSIGFCLYEIV